MGSANSALRLQTGSKSAIFLVSRRSSRDGKTAELVQTGIEREKAGTPNSSEIDAGFRDLTPATGKDWLAAYRKSARHQ